jgi:hypothetical protein
VNLLTLQELIKIINDHSGILAIIAVAILSLVEITPIKFNPWSWLGKKIGRMFNCELMTEMNNFKNKVGQDMGTLNTEIKSIKKDVADIREEAKEREATNRRARILEFGDEILHGTDYSKEHWDSILMDISEYEHYCVDHPHYMNNVAKATIKHIKHMYDKHLDEDSFL